MLAFPAYSFILFFAHLTIINTSKVLNSNKAYEIELEILNFIFGYQ